MSSEFFGRAFKQTIYSALAMVKQHERNLRKQRWLYNRWKEYLRLCEIELIEIFPIIF